MEQWIARVRTTWRKLLDKDKRQVRLLLAIELAFGFALVVSLLLLIKIFL